MTDDSAPAAPRTLAQRVDAWERLVRLDKPIGTLLLLWPTLTALWIAARGAPPLMACNASTQALDIRELRNRRISFRSLST